MPSRIKQVARTTTRPLISVLLPVFNAAATFPAAVHSIGRQTEARWECVVVDDGSDDGTDAAAQALAQRDGRFIVLRAPHRGLVAALNLGLTQCRAPYVARMDADDLMHRDRLAAQRQALDAAPELAAVGTHVRLFPRRQLGAGRRAYEHWLNSIDSPERLRAEAFVECPLAHPTLMIRRDTVTAFGYRDCDWPEDYDLLLRLLTGGHGVGVVPRRLLSWRDTPERLSRTAPRYDIGCFTACKAAFLATTFLGGADTYVLWGFGHTGRALLHALRVHGKRPTHIVEVHPGRVGNIIHGAPVIAPEDLHTIPRQPLIVSVAREPPRHRIRAALAQMGFVETRDFVCAA